MKTQERLKEIFNKNPNQDAVIDAIRALSVLSIIAFHVMVGITQIYDAEKTKQYILNMPNFLQPLWHGEKGVDAFFLISATVLGLPLFKYIESFNWQNAKAFYKKRFFRVYPLFLIALLLYTVGQWSYFGKYFLSNVLLINNLIEGERTIIPVGWSLLVEVQYYAVLPILFFILRKTKKKLAALMGLIGLSFVACAIRLLNNADIYLRPLTDLFLAEDRSEFSTRIGNLFYEANVTRFGPFAIGLLLAYLKINYAEKIKNIFKKQYVGTLVLICAFTMIAFSTCLPMYHPNSFYYKYLFSPTVNFLVLSSLRQIFALGLMFLILGCWYSENIFFKFFTRIFNWRLWTPFSKLSFPIYLFHFPFIALAAVVIFGTTDIKKIVQVGVFQGMSIFVLATALSVLFSIPLYLYIEQFFIKFGKKISRQTKV